MYSKKEANSQVAKIAKTRRFFSKTANFEAKVAKHGVQKLLTTIDSPVLEHELINELKTLSFGSHFQACEQRVVSEEVLC